MAETWTREALCGGSTLRTATATLQTLTRRPRTVGSVTSASNRPPPCSAFNSNGRFDFKYQVMGERRGRNHARRARAKDAQKVEKKGGGWVRYECVSKRVCELANRFHSSCCISSPPHRPPRPPSKYFGDKAKQECPPPEMCCSMLLLSRARARTAVSWGPSLPLVAPYAMSVPDIA
eukprot:2624456-Rhodomonas_salina.1